MWWYFLFCIILACEDTKKASVKKNTKTSQDSTFIKEKNELPIQAKLAEVVISNEPLYIQAGAFKNEKNADLLLKQLSDMGLENSPPFKKQFSEDLFHVVIGPFNSKDEANNIANLIKSKIKISIFVLTKEKN